jgi:hypothetical protein
VAAGGGTINATGLFTAGSTGTYTNTVEVVAVQGTTVELATTSVTVVASVGTLDHILVTPGTASVAPSGTQQFTAQGYDANNVAISGLTYTWSVVGTSGTISSTGLFTAGTATGTDTVQANAQGTTTPTGSATVTVTTTPAVTTTTAITNHNNNKSSLISLLKHYLKNIGSGNFLGGQWQVKNSSGGVDTYAVIEGVVQSASATSLVIIPNGQTATSTLTLTTSTVIQPKNATLAAGDTVMVLTLNNQVTMVSEINAATTTNTAQNAPGYGNRDNGNHHGVNIPHGWSQSGQNGWNHGSSSGSSGSGSNGD